MNKWFVAAVVMVVVPLLFIGGMFWFTAVMTAKERGWADVKAKLSANEQFAIDVARFWIAYWYVIAPPIALLGFGLGAAFAVVGVRKNKGAKKNKN
jgi:hypothetical protein